MCFVKTMISPADSSDQAQLNNLLRCIHYQNWSHSPVLEDLQLFTNCKTADLSNGYQLSGDASSSLPKEAKTMTCATGEL